MTDKQFAEAVAAHLEDVRNQLCRIEHRPVPDSRIGAEMTRNQFVAAAARSLEEIRQQLKRIEASTKATWWKQILNKVSRKNG